VTVNFPTLTPEGPHQQALHRIGLLVGVSVLAGLLVAGVALPVVGGLGLVAKRGVEQFDQLPSELKAPPLPQRTRILAKDGSVIATFYFENRVSVPLSQMAPVMQQAIVAIEDSRFYQHAGVDLKGVVRALATNTQAGTVRQGGSTITQQYVKNVLIEKAATEEGKQAAHETTLARKVREARYAIALERELTKDQILEDYLNIALFGGGAYGVEAASRRFFNLHASQLTLPQAALLAGMVRNPSAYDPTRHPKTSTARRNTVLKRMYELGMITGPAYTKAVTAKLALKPTESTNSCASSSAPFFCDYIQKRFLADARLGRTREDRLKLLLRGGLDIVSTLDTKMQLAAQRSVEKHVPRSSEFGSAIAMVEPGTGLVRAMAQNRAYGTTKKLGKNGARQTTVNYATDNAFGGSRGFQSGSTFKVFTLAAALEQGIPLSLRMKAPSSIDYGTLGPTDCSGNKYYDRSSPPKRAYNSEGHGGIYNMLTGTWHSVNTFFLLLEKKVGMCPIAKLAESMGVRQASGKPLQVIPSLTLGVNTVSPLAMSNAVATFAAHGKYCPATVITSVRDASGKLLPVTKPACKQVMKEGVADTVSQVLRGVISSGTGRGLGIGREAAGKTGTVTEYADAWFVGYTPQLAAGVFVGDPAGSQGNPLRNVTIGGHHYARVFGATIPGPIWQQAMQDALKGAKVLSFPPGDPKLLRGKPVPIPDVTGMTPRQAVDTLFAAGFEPVLGKGTFALGGTAGTVGATSPVAGTLVPIGTAVTFYVTNGQPPLAPAPGATSGPGFPPPSGPPPTTKPKKTKPPH
jgi:membrane peptidoglycan carboxypeptidase